MTDGEAVSLREHIDQRFDAVEKQVRGVHYRLTEVQDHNRAEHQAVTAQLNGMAAEYRDLAGRVDELEGHRDEKAGGRRILRRVGAIVAAVITATASLAAVWEVLLRG